MNFDSATAAMTIHDSVISGNTLSGVFDLVGASQHLDGNRIGVKAHSDDPLPNGASGIFIGPGGYGSRSDRILGPSSAGNVIAFNGETGVAVAAGCLRCVGYRQSDLEQRSARNRHRPGRSDAQRRRSPSSVSTLSVPTLTLAHYDPVSKKTIIEADVSGGGALSLYANDTMTRPATDEGQRPIGSTAAGCHPPTSLTITSRSTVI